MSNGENLSNSVVSSFLRKIEFFHCLSYFTFNFVINITTYEIFTRLTHTWKGPIDYVCVEAR